MHYILIAFLVFASIALAGLAWSIYRLYQSRLGDRQVQLANRITLLTEESGARFLLSSRNSVFSDIPILDTLLRNLRFVQWIRRKLLRSGFAYTPSQFLFTSGVLFLVGFAVTLYFTSAMVMAVIAGVILILLPYGLVEWHIHRRQATLEKQLPDVLEFIARSLKAGHSFNSSVQIAVSESPQPISSEFKLVFDQINFGAHIHDALEDLTHRVDCVEIRYFVIAVLVNREVGGDLAELLQNVAKLIRERLVLRQSIHVLTAEGRTSAWILGLLPFVLGGVISFINPTSIELLFTDDAGKQLLFFTLFMMLLGTYWMYRISSIKA
jgi:tight adherence protein B